MDIRQLTRGTGKFFLYSLWAITLLTLLLFLGSVGVPYLGPLVLQWIIEPLAKIGIAISTTLLAYVSAATTFVALIVVSRIAKALSRAKKYKQNKGVDIFKAVKTLFQAKLFNLKNLNKLLYHKQSVNFNDAIKQLHNKELRTQENFDLISKRADPLRLAKALRALDDALLTTPANKLLVINHDTPDTMTNILEGLLDAKLHNQTNFDAVRTHSKPKGAVDALVVLSEAHRPYTIEKRLALIRDHQDPAGLAEAIIELIFHKKFNTRENFLSIYEHNNPAGLAAAIRAAYNAGLDSQKTISILIKHPNPEELAEAVNALHNADLSRGSFFDQQIIMHLPPSFLCHPSNFEKLNKHKNPKGLAAGIKALTKAEIINPEYFELLIKHPYPEGLAKAVMLLHNAGHNLQGGVNNVLFVSLFSNIQNQHRLPDVAISIINLHDSHLANQSNIEAVSNAKEPITAAAALSQLKKDELLDKENIDLIINTEFPRLITSAFYQLKCAKLLTLPNKEAAAKHKTPGGLADAIELLLKKKLNSQENFDVLIKHQEHREVKEATEALIKLDKEAFLIPVTQMAIADSKAPFATANLLCEMKKANLTTPQNIKLALKHENPEDLAITLEALQNAKLSSEKNFILIAKHKDPLILRRALAWLISIGHINLREKIQDIQTKHQDTVKQILPIAYIFSHYESSRALYKLPKELFSPSVLKDIINVVTKAKGDLDKTPIAIRGYIGKLINADLLKRKQHANRLFNESKKEIDEIEQKNIEIENLEKENLKEVDENKTVSFSKLKKLYGHLILGDQLDLTLNNFEHWINILASNEKHDSAKAAFNWIIGNGGSISERQMALIWHGIQDIEKLNKDMTKEQALVRCIESLSNLQTFLTKEKAVSGKSFASGIVPQVSEIFDFIFTSPKSNMKLTKT